MSEREMNALADLMDFAGKAVKALRTKGLDRHAKDLERAIAEMKAATREADGEADDELPMRSDARDMD